MAGIELNYVSVILLLTVFQGGFYSLFLLLGKNRRRLSSRLLGAFTLVFTLHFANILLTEFGPLAHRPNFNPVFVTCYGPLLLLFIRSLIRPHFTMRGAARHFVAPLVTFLVIAVSGANAPVVDRTVLVLILVQLVAYLVAATSTLRSFKEDLQDRFSAIDRINLDWLTRLLKLVSFLFGIAIAQVIFQAAGLHWLESAFTILIFVTALYFVNTLVLKGMSHPSIDVWLDTVAPGSEHDALLRDRPAAGEGGASDSRDTTSDDARYAGSGLSPEESRALFERLRERMTREEPFLDENLNIHQLAESMGITSKHLSQVINQNSGQNFYDFINGYRIEKAKALLLDPRRSELRVSEVMVEAGYTAKSTFNSLFKQSTGLTPTEFRRKKGPSS